MEVSALTHAGVAGHHGRSPLLRLQSDERLIALVRRGNHHAFEALVGRYQARLLAFCRHMLSSREDAEDVLQETWLRWVKVDLGQKKGKITVEFASMEDLERILGSLAPGEGPVLQKSLLHEDSDDAED